MRPSIDIVAQRLLGTMGLPCGAANTMVVEEGRGHVIRVLLDPAYWSRESSIPRTYSGYRVTVVERPAARAH